MTKRLPLLVLLAACASAPEPHRSELDGPIEYVTGSGFFGYASRLRVELDGSATRTVTTSSAPGQSSVATTTGTVAPAVLDQLRADVAAVDLASFREVYSCDDFGCNNADRGGDSLAIAADGETVHVSVDAAIPPGALPAGLVRLLEDVKAIELAP
jgi:hypothetical protein